MEKTTSLVRVRFAPAPTGHLHVGGLRTALFNYLFAKHHKGMYLLRCEDTDIERSTTDFFASQMESFSWVGILPDEPVIIQSSRFAEHAKIINKLLNEEKAYKCFCSEQDLLERLGKRSDGEVFIKYDQHCLTHKKVYTPNASYVVRFRMPQTEHAYTFFDLIRGQVTFSSEQYDDFIIVRSDGVPVYNLVAVIDDAFMNISHVIRGEEHLSNTPKQIALYHACGYSVPQFAHLPMILGASGQKLSKREGATSVNEYKTMGYLPEALLNYLVRLGWAYKDQEIFSIEELVALFSLEGVGKKGAIFDPEKLNWLNSMYIKKYTAQQLYLYMCVHLQYELLTELAGWSLEHIYRVIDYLKERVITLSELKKELMLLKQGPVFVAETIKDEEKIYIKKVKEKFLKDGISVQSVKEVAKESNISMTTVAQLVRCVLTGKSNGLGIGDLFVILSKQDIIYRLERCEAT